MVWCPDWPVMAAILSGEVPGSDPWSSPVVVVRANRIVACSGAARIDGVRRGMRRREAQACSPAVEVLSADPARDARSFEPIVAAVGVFSPLVEIVRPGVCQLATKGPSRYFGGDEALSKAIVEAVAGVGVEARVGIAEGPFAAGLAARAGYTAGAGQERQRPLSEAISTAGAGQERQRPLSEAWYIVRPGATSEFLSTLPVGAAAAAVEDPELGDLLVRLGICTLGQLAGLPAADVLARFGPNGDRARRLAAGLDPDVLRPQVPPPDLAVAQEFDTPLDRVDTAAFVARMMADELNDRLTGRGLACTSICIEARMEDGSELARRWRHERAGAPGGLTPEALADRVRWQLDGWLLARRSDPQQKAGGITHLRLIPEEVIPDEGRQLGFWGASEADERAARAFARIQGLLGPDAVSVPLLTGGRSPDAGLELVTWGDARPATRAKTAPTGRLPVSRPTAGSVSLRPATSGSAVRSPEVPTVSADPDLFTDHDLSADHERIERLTGFAARPSTSGSGRNLAGLDLAGPCAPWPGRLPAPLPALIHRPPLPADVLDASGSRVSVNGRGACNSAPEVFQHANSRRTPILGWTGPWPVEERWWDLATARRQARFQLLTDDGAFLVVLEAGTWWVAATYA